MPRNEYHLCEWCRRSTELTHIKAIDEYLCDGCVEIYNERIAKAWEEQLSSSRDRFVALFDDFFGPRRCEN